MPSYVVSTAGRLLNQEKKARLAAAITEIHRDATGADGLFARVAFHALENEDCYLGARMLAQPHCFIDGRIRAGRAAEVRDRLMERIVTATAEILDIPPPAVWLYISELPPSAMIEYGQPLPDPGGEAAWLEGLAAVDRDFVRRASAS